MNEDAIPTGKLAPSNDGLDLLPGMNAEDSTAHAAGFLCLAGRREGGSDFTLEFTGGLAPALTIADPPHLGELDPTVCLVHLEALWEAETVPLTQGFHRPTAGAANSRMSGAQEGSSSPP